MPIVVVRLRGTRLQAQRGLVLPDRIGEPVGLVVGIAEAVVRLGRLRIELHCALVGGDRFRKPVQAGEGGAEVAEGLCVAGIGADRLHKMIQGLAGVAQAEEGGAQAVFGLRVTGFEPQGSGEGLSRLCIFAPTRAGRSRS